MDTPFENEVAKRFGVLPNFFRLNSTDPKIGENLWAFARFAYLDNPLPSLFKERLFVYLSRFCEIRYCIARHVGFLVGLGYPAGDSSCLPQKVESVLPLLRRPLPHGDKMLALLASCANLKSSLSSFPGADTPEEEALFACATHVFLQTPDASQAQAAIRRALEPQQLEQLNLLLAFVHTAHYWTKLHPELPFEDDVKQLFTTHQTLAQCILKDPETQADSLSRQVAAELASLRHLRKEHESIAQAYQELSIDHQSVKHSLHETEEHLRELVSVMPAAVYTCDRDGVITYFNRQAVALWNQTPNLDDPPWAFLNSRRIYRMDESSPGSGTELVKEVLATGVPIVNRELVLERPDLSRVNLLASISTLRDREGNVSGAVSIFQDVTELKRIQQERDELLHELERSNRELSQFSYEVSHDLQAPVHSVRALTQLLVRRAGNLQKDSPQLLIQIEQATAGMERLIGSLLQYAQVGQGQLNSQRVQLDHIVESVRLTLAPLITETGAQIVCSSLPEVEADPVLLERLFQNLVANAIQYHRPHHTPVIEISGGHAEQGWQFAVKDNGQGIPHDHQVRIFEPLKRLHGSETPGTGLGLALCRTIVARHGGRIWVESEGSGCGSVFRFTLLEAPEASLAAQSNVGGLSD